MTFRKIGPRPKWTKYRVKNVDLFTKGNDILMTKCWHFRRLKSSLATRPLKSTRTHFCLIFTFRQLLFLPFLSKRRNKFRPFKLFGLLSFHENSLMFGLIFCPYTVRAKKCLCMSVIFCFCKSATQKWTAFVFGNIYLYQTFTKSMSGKWTC